MKRKSKLTRKEKERFSNKKPVAKYAQKMQDRRRKDTKEFSR